MKAAYSVFCFNDTATTGIYTYGHTLSLRDALPIYAGVPVGLEAAAVAHERQRDGTENADRLPAGGERCIGRGRAAVGVYADELRPEEHTSELQSLMRISYAVFCLKKKRWNNRPNDHLSNNTHTRTTVLILAH